MEKGGDNRPVVKGEVVKLDYASLRDTIYVHCKLVFAGGRPPSIVGCDITECEFIFENEAMNTLHFMQSLAHAGDGDLVVKQMLGLEDWVPLDGDK